MNIFIAILLFVLWRVTALIYQHKQRTHWIDRQHVKKRNVFRFFSIIFLSLTIFLILNPKITGTSISFESYSLWIIWSICFIDGIKYLYDITGPILSKKFVSILNSKNYAVYLRSFNWEKNHFVSSVEINLCEFLKKAIPVFAIGDPYEILSKTGAERLYASDTDWEDMIVDLITHSKMIIIRPSDSVGCLIELNHIVKLGLLSKCLFLVSSKEEISVLRNHLKLKQTLDLENLEKNIAIDKVLGLKVDVNGKYSSFLFESSNDNLTNFLILYSIGINEKANSIHLSISQHIIDRIAFLLNPLFYSSIFEWGLIQKIMVSILMSCPVILLHFYANDLSIIMLLLLFISFLLLLLYLLFKVPYISQSRSQFASATHYMTRVRFLSYFNIVFIISLVMALFYNPAFANSFFQVISKGYEFFIYLLDSYKLPLFITIGIICLYYLWKKVF